jgi:hypothetical protein
MCLEVFLLLRWIHVATGLRCETLVRPLLFYLVCSYNDNGILFAEYVNVLLQGQLFGMGHIGDEQCEENPVQSLSLLTSKNLLDLIIGAAGFRLHWIA